MSPLRLVLGGLLLVTLPALPLAAATPRGGYPASRQPIVAPTAGEHKVTRGETLWSISQKHGTSVGAIMDYNHLPDHNVREGMILRVPPRVVEQPPPPPGNQHLHTVRRSEDFWDIADRYEIKPSILGRANPTVNPNKLQEGMVLVIPAGEEGDRTTRPSQPPLKPTPQPQQPRPSSSMVQHTVGENETFYSIGRRYGVSMESVVAANPGVKPERLRAGMKVWIPSKNGGVSSTSNKPTSASTSPSSQKPAVYRGETHKVKEDESIASIAKRYGVTESALMRENNLTEDDVIYVDDLLKIPSSGRVASAPPTAPSQGSKPSAQTSSSSTKPAPSTPTGSKPKPPTSSGGATPANTVGNDGTIRSYIVSSGENEATICDAFGITKQQLYDYNRLSPNTKLKAGDEIAIPKVTGRKR